MEEAKFATTTRRVIAPEARLAILTTSRSKAHKDPDQLRATILRKGGATEMTAHIPMPLTKTELNRKSINLLIYCVKTQSKKDSATRDRAQASMENGALLVKFAKQKSKESLPIPNQTGRMQIQARQVLPHLDVGGRPGSC